jgi:hypothetical protein
MRQSVARPRGLSRNLLKNGQICAVEGPKSSDDSSALMLNRLFRVPR